MSNNVVVELTAFLVQLWVEKNKKTKNRVAVKFTTCLPKGCGALVKRTFDTQNLVTFLETVKEKLKVFFLKTQIFIDFEQHLFWK